MTGLLAVSNAPDDLRSRYLRRQMFAELRFPELTANVASAYDDTNYPGGNYRIAHALEEEETLAGTAVVSVVRVHFHDESPARPDTAKGVDLGALEHRTISRAIRRLISLATEEHF